MSSLRDLKLSRRLVLRGFGGALIGLPLLEVQANGGPRGGPTGGKPVPKRFVVFFEHGGTLSNVGKDGVRYDGTGAESAADGWSPLSPGEVLVPGPILQALSAHTDSLLQLRGVDNAAGRRATYLDGDHGYNNATVLTCANASTTGTSAEHEKSAHGPSIDRVLAERLALRNPVPFTSVHLMVDGYHYGTPFYRAAHQQVAPQKDPVAAFDALFAGVREEGVKEEPAAARARALRRSVLDGTSELTRQFRRRLGARDQQTVDAHLEHLRELEQRLEQLALPQLPGCVKPTAPGVLSNPDEIGRAHVDILLAALRCGLTHVGALEIGDLEALWLSPPYISEEGNAHAMHHLSMATGLQGSAQAHHAAWVAAMIQNRRWRLSLLGRFLDGLKAIPEGLGNMLDTTVCLWTSEFSNGGAHSGADVPLLLAGGTGGRLRGGRHLDFNRAAVGNPGTALYDSRTSLHNVYTSLLNLFDYGDVHFGNALTWEVGPVPGLV